jgi:hypothetical protein
VGGASTRGDNSLSMKEVADKIVVNKAPFFMEQNIKVAIRTRPLLESEKLRKAKRRQTILDNVDQVKDRTLSVLGSNIVVFGTDRLTRSS